MPSRHVVLEKVTHWYAHVFNFKEGHNSEGCVIKGKLKNGTKRVAGSYCLRLFKLNYNGRLSRYTDIDYDKLARENYEKVFDYSPHYSN